MGCPQTEDEFRDYFFNLIGQNLNGVANNFEAVMTKAYNWNGTMMQIPVNVPTQGQQLPKDAPFYGLTQQHKMGRPAARIWIPAAIPDANNYYTRNIQYIKDTPNGNHGVDFLWDWRWQDGNAYVPLLPADGGTTPVPPNPPVDPELEKKVQILELKVARLEKLLGKVGLKSAANNKFVANELTHDQELRANRDNLGGWEEFYIITTEND